MNLFIFFFSSRRRHTRSLRDWSSDVCSSDLEELRRLGVAEVELRQELSRASERSAAIDVEVARIEAEADEARRRLDLAGTDERADGEDREELAERLARLERRREALGQVNPFAKEEYDAEKAR